MSKEKLKKSTKEENDREPRRVCRTYGGLFIFCPYDKTKIKHNCANCDLKSDIWG